MNIYLSSKSPVNFYCVMVLRAPKYGTSAALKAAAGPAGAAVFGA